MEQAKIDFQTIRSESEHAFLKKTLYTEAPIRLY